MVCEAEWAFGEIECYKTLKAVDEKFNLQQDYASVLMPNLLLTQSKTLINLPGVLKTTV
jgi:hypothetical protein